MQNSNTSSDIKIENTTDIDEFTKIANMTYTVYNDAGTPFNPYDDYTQNNKGLFMFVSSPADDKTGYILFNVKALEHEDQIFTQHKPRVQGYSTHSKSWKVRRRIKAMVGSIRPTATLTAPAVIIVVVITQQ